MAIEKVEADTEATRILKLKKLVADLQERYNDSRLDESESGRVARAAVSGQLKRLSHDTVHPDEDYIELEVPPAITGEAFMINEVEYKGVVIVPACVASTLLHMMERNREVDMQRMRESGRTIDLGQIINRARAIQAEN